MSPTMVNSPSADALLKELHEEKVKELIPMFVILGVLMLFGLLGNISILVCVWPIAKQSISSFFIQVLSIVDILVCLTISLAIFNYTTIYMFTNDAVCKIYVFSKFVTALFSGYVLIVVAAYRYRKICRPMKKQLSLKGAKIAVGAGIFVVLTVSVPQLFLLDTVEMEVPNEYNVTLIGSDCVTQALDNPGLKAFATGLEGFYLICFVVASAAMVIIYVLLARAIVKMNRNRIKLRQNSIRGRSKSFTEHTDVYDKSRDFDKNGDDNPEVVSVPAARIANQNKTKHHVKIPSQPIDKSGLVSMAKVTVMFFIISLGFILTFLPYMTYAIWRTFVATKEDILFTTKAHHLFGLNSYIINSVINPAVLAIFNDQYRQFLCRQLCRCKRQDEEDTADA